MNEHLLVFIFVFLQCVGMAGEKTNEVSPCKLPATECVRQTYTTMRTSALSGGADEKLDAFLYVYENADELKTEIAEALGFLAESAASGNADAQYNFGYLIQTGTFVKQDESKALPWLLLAAQKGHVSAQFWAGVNFASQYYGSDDGPDRESYYFNSVRWLKSAIDSAGERPTVFQPATEALGRLYFSKECTRNEGIRMLELLALDGYVPAQDTLAAYSDLIVEWHALPESSKRYCDDNMQKSGR